MCGLSGVVVTNPKLIPMELVKAIFSLLMEENDDRGGHSWGAWGSGLEPVRHLGKYSFAPQPLHDHLRLFAFQPEGLTFLFGHTRYGTHGEKTVENAHPFEMGNLTLAHNGVVQVDGYGDSDHAVDSGRIAKAIVERGYEDGLAKVEGSCALLLSVDGYPYVYRHNQVLNYASFDWGSVISSTLVDLELVVKKRLGLEPIFLGTVPEDVICTPGFGDVYQPAPAKKCKPLAYTQLTHTAARWWEGEEGYGLFPYEQDYDDRCGDWSRKEANPEQETIGFRSQEFSGKSDLPKEKAVQAQVKRLVAAEKDCHKAHKIADNDDVMAKCEYCGLYAPIDDTYMCSTDWTDGNMLAFCMDCIQDEILTKCAIVVHGPYDPWMESDPFEIADVEMVSPRGENIDVLSDDDRKDLEDHIAEHYGGIHDL